MASSVFISASNDAPMADSQNGAAAAGRSFICLRQCRLIVTPGLANRERIPKHFLRNLARAFDTGAGNYDLKGVRPWSSGSRQARYMEKF
jgi:hypothetical protein